MFFQLWKIQSSVNLLFAVILKNVMRNREIISAMLITLEIWFRTKYQKNCQLQSLTLRSINFNSLQCNSVALTVIEFSLIFDSWQIIGENNRNPLGFVCLSWYTVKNSTQIPVQQHFYSGATLNYSKCILLRLLENCFIVTRLSPP